MDILELREYCLALPLAEETTPFDEMTLVYKVAGKMFLLTDMADFRWINVKCDPDRAVELRDRYAEVKEGYHMNKRHWNTVDMAGDLPVGGEFPAACQAGNAVAAVGGGQNINPGLRTIQNRQS